MSITIIGNGRFGTYLAHQIKAATGKDPVVVGPENHPAEIAKNTYTAIFCVPIRTFKDTWETWLPHWKPGTVVMDTCSVKTYPCKIMGKSPRKDLTLAGTHPLFGPQSAPVSCAGQRTAIIPICGSPAPVRTLWETTLKTIPILCSEEDHDRQMGTQLLNHFIGRAAHKAGIARVELSTKTHELFMDIVDIVVGNSEELFEDMNRFNPYAPEIRQRFLTASQQLEQEMPKP